LAQFVQSDRDDNDDPDDKWEGVREVLKHVDVLLLNEREAKKLTGTDNLSTAIEHLAKLVPIVVVKLGEKGAMARRSAEEFSAPAVSVKAIDPVGAGEPATERIHLGRGGRAAAVAGRRMAERVSRRAGPEL